MHFLAEVQVREMEKLHSYPPLVIIGAAAPVAGPPGNLMEGRLE